MRLDDALRVETAESLPLGQWVHVAVAYDGSRFAEGVQLFVNGQPAKLDVIQPGLVDWSIVAPVPADNRIVAAAIDEAGNQETLSHVLMVTKTRRRGVRLCA